MGLTKTQEELASLCSDILMNGAEKEELYLFLKALDQHRTRRALMGIYMEFGAKQAAIERNKAAIEMGVQEHRSSLHVPECWHEELSREWPERRPGTAQEHSAATASPVRKFVRARIDESLREGFERFMTDQDGIEQMWILNEVLEYVNGGGDEIPSAFALALQSDQTYVRVPWNRAEEVRDFVKSLEKRPA